jgi:hypothetical protein
MKKLFVSLMLLVVMMSYSQAKHYICFAPNVAFNSTIQDPENLIGCTLEIGKYVGDTAIGITTGLYSIDIESLYSEVIVTVPISKELPITVSAGIGWFYFQKDITMEYDINYAFRLRDNLSLIVTYNTQSAFGTTSQAFCIGLNKDF